MACLQAGTHKARTVKSTPTTATDTDAGAHKVRTVIEDPLDLRCGQDKIELGTS